MFERFNDSCFVSSYAQNDTLQNKLNVIIQEANLLYNYEKVTWNASDLLASKKKLTEHFGGYVTYHSGDTIYATFLHKEKDNRIAKYSFTADNLKQPFDENYDDAQLTANEKKLATIKVRVIEQLADPKYEVQIPEGYDPNLVLVKDETEYRLYIIMGTTQENTIPFGNDYVFHTDFDGNINDWKKFHSRIIPAQSEVPGVGIILSAMHSHLRTTPYITATDICTFRLYFEYEGIEEFKVYSLGMGTYFTYNIARNVIVVGDDLEYKPE